MSRHHNSGQNRNIIANGSFGNMAKFKCLGKRVTNQNLIQEEIKNRSKSGNVLNISVQNLVPSCLLSENVMINTKS
jgi:hypothetical protein